MNKNYFNEVELGCPDMVEPVKGVEDNEVDDEADNDFIRMTVLYTARVWSHHVQQGIVLAGIVSLRLNMMSFPELHI